MYLIQHQQQQKDVGINECQARQLTKRILVLWKYITRKQASFRRPCWTLGLEVTILASFWDMLFSSQLFTHAHTLAPWHSSHIKRAPVFLCLLTPYFYRCLTFIQFPFLLMQSFFSVYESLNHSFMQLQQLASFFSLRLMTNWICFGPINCRMISTSLYLFSVISKIWNI